MNRVATVTLGPQFDDGDISVSSDSFIEWHFTSSWHFAVPCWNSQFYVLEYGYLNDILFTLLPHPTTVLLLRTQFSYHKNKFIKSVLLTLQIPYLNQ